MRLIPLGLFLTTTLICSSPVDAKYIDGPISVAVVQQGPPRRVLLVVYNSSHKAIRVNTRFAVHSHVYPVEFYVTLTDSKGKVYKLNHRMKIGASRQHEVLKPNEAKGLLFNLNDFGKLSAGEYTLNVSYQNNAKNDPGKLSWQGEASRAHKVTIL